MPSMLGCRLLPALLACLVLLSPTGPAPARDSSKPDLRPRIVVQRGHGNGAEATIKDVCWSTDGKRVLTGSGDGSVILWDAQHGRQMHIWYEYAGFDNTPAGEPEPIMPGWKSSLAMSPAGLLVAFCQRDTPPALIDVVPDVDLRHRIPNVSDPHVAVAFSGDGRYLICGVTDGNVDLHDRSASERKSHKQLSGSGKSITVIQAVQEKPEFYVGDVTGVVRRWTYKGRATGTFKHEGAIKAIACTPTGTRLLAATATGHVRLWDTAKDKKPLQEIRPDGGGIRDADLSADGKQIVLVTKDGLVRFYDAETGTAGRIHREESGVITNAAFSPDGTRLLITTGRDPLIIDVKTGEPLTRFPGSETIPFVAAFTPDQRHLTVGYSDTGIHTWNLLAGTRTTRHDVGLLSPLHRLSMSRDGRLVFAGQTEGKLRILDQHAGEVLMIPTPPANGGVSNIAFLRNGREVIVGFYEGQVEQWSLETKQKVRDFEQAPDSVIFLELSQDGRRLLGGTTDAHVSLVWSVKSGQIVQRLKGAVWGQCGAITADGAKVFTRPEDLIIKMSSVSKNKTLQTYPNKKQANQGHQEAITSVALSPDGKQLFTGAWDDEIIVWDVKTGTYRGSLQGNTQDVASLDISADGRFLVSTSADRTVRFFDIKSRRLLCTLVTFPGTHDWAVFDAEGRFDGSNNGRVPQIHFAMGLETFGLDQLRRRYYEPGLLAKHLGYSPDALTRVEKLPPPKPAPKVETSIPDPSNPVLEIKAVGQGKGGVGQIEVRLNGKQIIDDARGGTVSRGSQEEATTVELANDPRLLPGRENTVETIVWNTEGTTSAKGWNNFHAPGSPSGEPHLHAILCGVSDYAGDGIDLKYAAKDARDFSEALKLAGTSAFGAERVHITVLTSGAHEGETAATRDNLRRAFEALSVPGAVKSEDIFVVYLSGHGRTFGKKDKDYYYLCADAESEDLSDPTTRQSVAVSSRELLGWIAAVPAVHRQLMVLDTCAAGRVRDELRGRMGISSTQRLALGEVSEKTGMFVLAGCAADQVSYESSQFGQGLLTYALLFGMSCGCDFKETERIDVRRLINFAQELVPRLAQVAGLSSIQKPVKTESDESFEMGSLTEEERARIPVQKPKPVLTRASFQRERPPRDTLKFSGILDDAVKRFAGKAGEVARATQGRPVMVFADTTSMRGAYSLAGRYRREGKEMSVMVGIYFDDGDEGADPIAEFKLNGLMDTPEEKQAIAERVLELAYQEHILPHHRARRAER